MIASGPTVPDPSTFADAYAVLERYQIVERVPAAVKAHLEAGRRGEIPDTPKPGNPVFDRVQNVLVGSNTGAAAAACRQAAEEGCHALLLTTRLTGEAQEAGRFLATILRQAAEPAESTAFETAPGKSGALETGRILTLARPACIVAGGETTVTIKGDGLGGGLSPRKASELCVKSIQTYFNLCSEF